MSHDNSQSIGLAEMINCLRGELELAKINAGTAESDVLLEVEKIDLQLQVNVEKVKEVDGKFGVKFWVVNAGAGGKEADKHTTTQVFKITLHAKDRKNGERKLNVCG